LSFRPQYAAALGSHKLNKIVARTNTALQTLSEQVQQQMCNVEVRQFQELNLKAKQQPSKTIFRAGGKMIVSRGSLLAIRHCSTMPAHTRITPLCYIDQPVTYQGKPLFRDSNSWVLMTSSNQVLCASGSDDFIKMILCALQAQSLEIMCARQRNCVPAVKGP
jgi:hypothetical protein